MGVNGHPFNAEFQSKIFLEAPELSADNAHYKFACTLQVPPEMAAVTIWSPVLYHLVGCPLLSICVHQNLTWPKGVRGWRGTGFPASSMILAMLLTLSWTDVKGIRKVRYSCWKRTTLSHLESYIIVSRKPAARIELPRGYLEGPWTHHNLLLAGMYLQAARERLITFTIVVPEDTVVHLVEQISNLYKSGEWDERLLWLGWGRRYSCVHVRVSMHEYRCYSAWARVL